MRTPFSWLFRHTLEQRLVHSLLRSPLSRRVLDRAAKAVYEVRHGKSPEHMSATQSSDTENRGIKKFAELFWDEIKTGHRPDPPKR